MQLDGIDKKQLEKLKRELLAFVPSDGSKIGNKKLISQLTSNKKWTIQQVWDIRNQLIDEAVLEKGKGKGGSVKLSDIKQVEVIKETAGKKVLEPKLYEPMRKVLHDDWAPDMGLKNVIVEITAKKLPKNYSGKWTQPDITMGSYRTFPWLHGKYFDIITFEVKPFDMLDITVVYEALAHRRASTKAYVIVYIPQGNEIDSEDKLIEIIAEAGHHGIGVIVATDASDFETWETKLEAIRSEPEPDALNKFITSLSQEFKDQWAQWLR